MVPRSAVPNKVLLALLAGACGAVIYTLSPLTVVAFGLSVVLLRVAGTGLPAHEQRWLWTLLLLALAVRVAVVAVMFLISEHDAQAAAILTGDEAYSLSRTLRVRSILLGLPLLKHDYQIAFEEYGQTSYLTLLTVLQVLFGPSPYGLRLINVLLFLVGALLLFRTARSSFGSLPAFAGLAGVLFLPTLFFWSISLLKESLYFALAASIVTSVYWAVRSSSLRIRIGALAFIVLALWLLSDLRGGAVYLIGGGTLIGLVAFVLTASSRRFAAAAIVGAVAVAVALSQPGVRARILNGLNQAAQVQLGHVFTQGHAYKTLDEGFYVAWQPDLSLTPGEAARYVVRSLVSFLVVPFPWRMATPSELAFMPEHVLWYLALLLVPFGIAAGVRRDRLLTCLLVGIMLPTVAVVALTNGNVGTLIRFRGLVWPYLLFLVTFGACVLLQRALERSRAHATIDSAIAQSVIARTGRNIHAVGLAALSQSRVLTRLRTSFGRWGRTAPADQLRILGFGSIGFVATHLLLLAAIPESVVPAMPLLFWTMVLLAGIILAAAAEALTQAWASRYGGSSATPA